MAAVVGCIKFSEEINVLVRERPGYSIWLDQSKLFMGPYPNATHEFDFAAEVLRPLTTAKAPKAVAAPTALEGGRRTGAFVARFRDRRVAGENLREVLAAGLLELEAMRPGTLLQLESRKPRSKRVVARQREHLYDDQKLVEQFSRSLAPGWYFATNNSAAEVRRFLSVGADMAGLSEAERSFNF